MNTWCAPHDLPVPCVACALAAQRDPDWCVAHDLPVPCVACASAAQYDGDLLDLVTPDPAGTP